MRDPRHAALKVLTGLEATPKHLDRLLDEALSGLTSPGERATATNLVYTVLRNRLWLDYLLEPHLSRPLHKLDAGVISLLRLGAAQAALLDKPDHAVVNETVEMAKKSGTRKASGLINAVMRKVCGAWRKAEPPGESCSPEYLAVQYSHPRWLVEEMVRLYGSEAAGAWLSRNQQPSPLVLRANTLKTSRGDLADALRIAGLEAEPHPLCDVALRVRNHRGQVSELPGWADGWFQVQDPASQAIAPLLGVEPGMKVLDMCAGMGGKTGHLAALMQGRGDLLALDQSAGRIKALKTNLARLGGGDMLRAKAGDALECAENGFERILIDAPCTGLGVLGSRPDMRWKRKPGDIKEMAALQARLLDHAATLLAPGGAILYATCTFAPAENQNQVEAFLQKHPEFRPEWGEGESAPGPGLLDEAGYWRSLPHIHRSGAFFAARLVMS